RAPLNSAPQGAGFRFANWLQTVCINQSILRYYMMNRIWSLCLFLVAMLSMASRVHGAEIRVLTTIMPVDALARELFHGVGKVERLLPDSVGPHDYALTPRDLVRFQDIDVVLVNGLGLESWLEEAIRKAGLKTPPLVLELGSGLDADWIHSHE